LKQDETTRNLAPKIVVAVDPKINNFPNDERVCKTKNPNNLSAQSSTLDGDQNDKPDDE